LLRLIVVVLLIPLCAAANAEPFALLDACFVRTEPAPSGPYAKVKPVATESRLGIRRKAGQLFDVELSVLAPNGAVCSISGVAKLRPDESLVLPVRPESVPSAGRPATPCLVSFRSTSEAIEVAISEAACQAQALCAGEVQLQGQRFEFASRVPSNGSACFVQPAR
jgi:hypothetical protein